MIRALESAPRSIDELAEVDPKVVHAKLALLDDLGLLLRGPETSERAFASFERDVLRLPWVDQVELTNACPMRCVMCPTGNGTMKRPIGFMSRALFTKLVLELATEPAVKPLTLHNLGESLLHPELDDFVRIAKEAGFATELSVNPGHLPLDRYSALAAAGLDRLVVALDGVEPATLEAIRGKAARGAAAFGNLEALLEHRRRCPAPRPEIVIQMIRLPSNEAEQTSFLDRYAKRSIEGVVAYLKDPDANTREVVVGHPIFTRGRSEAVRPYLCRAPWRTAVVLWDGKVVPCCHDANGEIVLGDLNASTLAEIWAGEPLRALRSRLRNGTNEHGEPCAGCAHRPDAYRRQPIDSPMPEEPLHW